MMQAQCHICPYCNDDHADSIACDEILRLAKLGAAVEEHYGKRAKLIAEDDYSDGCPLCGDRR